MSEAAFVPLFEEQQTDPRSLSSDGTCVRDYLHVVDLAHGHILALDGIAEDKVFDAGAEGKVRLAVFNYQCCLELTLFFCPQFKAYNLGRGQAYSVLQIIDAMAKATGYKYEYEIVGRRDGDVPDLTANPELAQKELGFVAKRGLEEACEDLVRWQNGNPTGYPDQQQQ